MAGASNGGAENNRREVSVQAPGCLFAERNTRGSQYKVIVTTADLASPGVAFRQPHVARASAGVWTHAYDSARNT